MTAIVGPDPIGVAASSRDSPANREQKSTEVLLCAGSTTLSTVRIPIRLAAVPAIKTEVGIRYRRMVGPDVSADGR